MSPHLVDESFQSCVVGDWDVLELGVNALEGVRCDLVEQGLELLLLLSPPQGRRSGLCQPAR